MTTHLLKLQSQYYKDVASGKKTFEVRREDRTYRKGDILRLFEVGEDGLFIKPKHSMDYRVTYILTHDQFPKGVPFGYVVMSIVKIEPQEASA